MNDIHNKTDVVEITDDIILYINDTLKWMPQKQTYISQSQLYGLNYHGITEIDN